LLTAAAPADGGGVPRRADRCVPLGGDLSDWLPAWIPEAPTHRAEARHLAKLTVAVVKLTRTRRTSALTRAASEF
jgi:hypothetical protein